jgi:hypothetical protein
VRCKACNELMSDYEATVRSVFTREYIGLCKHCLGTIKTDVVAVGNIGLMSDEDDSPEPDTEEISGLADDIPDDDYYRDLWNDR